MSSSRASEQVAERVRTDPRVTVMERTNLRTLSLQDLPGQQPCDLGTLDLSFISVTAVLPAVLGLLMPQASLLVLIKPQFEADRDQVRPGHLASWLHSALLQTLAVQVESGGLVTDPAVHKAVVDKVVAAASAAGLSLQGVCESPVPGLTSGNKEYLALFRRAGAAAQASGHPSE